LASPTAVSIKDPERKPMKYRVRVYFNLHKRMFSVQHKTGKGWRLWKHLDHVCLNNVVFKVSEAGRKRVIKESKKNVHAYIEGDIHGNVGFKPDGKENSISYNPYKFNQFYFSGKRNLIPITEAKSVQGWVQSNKQPTLIAYS